MNTSSPSADTTDTAPEAMTAWEMACAILVGLRKAEAVARAEHSARLAEAGNKSFGKGVMTATHLVELLFQARRDFEPELRAIARANRFAVPELPPTGSDR